MKIISEMSKDVLDVFKKQNYNENYNYKKSIYIKQLIFDNDILLYNTFTNEMIMLDKVEYDEFANDNLKENNFILYRFLVTHWYLIPDEYTEKMMIYLYRNMKHNTKLIDNKMNSFIVLTTTDCNARCYYCFELGTRRIKMTEQTALDVAKYIEKKADHNKPVHISWFGGEPLYNSEAIDIIIKYITDNGLKCNSTMITNGYLFDEKTINKAVNQWNLKRIQITLDGTSEIYNKTKAYIYKNDIDPFNTILNNIEGLAKAGVYVNIRCNLSSENFLDLYKLIDIIDEKFKEYKSHVAMYFSVLYETSTVPKRTDEQENITYKQLYQLEDYCVKKNLFAKERNTVINLGGIKMHHCMADDSGSVIISPEGKLGSCEHYVDSDFYGSIYDECKLNRDYSGLCDWKKKSKELTECLTCPYYPKCYHITKCSTSVAKYPFCFNNSDRMIERAMIRSYNQYKSRNKENCNE